MAALDSSDSCGCLLAWNKAFGMVGGVACLATGDGVTVLLMGVMVGMLPNCGTATEEWLSSAGGFRSLGASVDCILDAT